MKVNEEDVNIVCDICLDPEAERFNSIVICDLCLVAVHQKCYERDIFSSIPEGDWFCNRCSALIEREKSGN